MTATERKRLRKVERKLRRVEGICCGLVALVVITGVISLLPEKGTPTIHAAEKIPTPVIEETPEIITAPRYDATADELLTVARVVHSEACGEGFDGQALVAQCILNTAEATGMRPDEVVLAKGQYASPAKEPSEEVYAAVEAVFLQGYTVTDEKIRYFYSPANTYSAWHENNLDYVLTHGGHKFFK